MMTMGYTKRPLYVKLMARLESIYLAWRIRCAERDVQSIRAERIAAFAHADRLSLRIESYEEHITVLAQRLGRARWK